MKKWIVSMLLITLFAINAGPAIGGGFGPRGPAPNAGDCIPDGSGFENPSGPNGNNSGKGPAPNSGDGVPDGSGFESPNGSIGNNAPDSGKGPAPNSGDCVPDGSGF